MKKRTEAWTLCCIQPCQCGKQWPMHVCVCVYARALFWVLQLDIHCHFHSTQCEFHFICRPGWIFTLFIYLFLFLRWFSSEDIDQKLLKYTMHIIENVSILCDVGMDVMWCWTLGWLVCWQLTHFLICLLWSIAHLLYQICQMYLFISCQSAPHLTLFCALFCFTSFNRPAFACTLKWNWLCGSWEFTAPSGAFNV